MKVYFYIRVIIINLLVAVIIPVIFQIRWLPKVWVGITMGEYEYYDFDPKSLSELLYYIYGKSYWFDYFVGLFLILLPFQILKLKLIGLKKYSFILNALLLFAVVLFWIIILGFFGNVWTLSDGWHNFQFSVIYSIGFSLIFTTLLYFTVDRYVEKDEPK